MQNLKRSSGKTAVIPSFIRKLDIKSRWFTCLIFILISLVIASFYYIHLRTSLISTTSVNHADEAVQLASGETITQNIKLNPASLESISIMFGTNARVNQGTVTVSLSQNDKAIQTWTTDASSLQDNTWHLFVLSTPLSVSDFQDNTFSITIREDYTGNNGIAVWASTHATDASAMQSDKQAFSNQHTLCFSASQRDLNLNRHCKIVFTALFVLLMLMIILRIDERIIMSFLLISLCIVYLHYCPTGMAPDEASHFYRAYEISCGDLLSKHMGTSGVGGNILPTALASYAYPDAVIDLSDVSEFHYGNLSLYAPICYLPQAIGIKIARCFTNHVYMIFLAGRIGNTIAAVLLCLFALYMMPFGRKILFTIMLFPMTLQEMISLSPDSLAISLSFAVTAWVFHLSYRNGPIRKKEILLLTILFFVLSLCKIVYVSLIFLVFLIPAEKAGGKRKSLIMKFGIFIGSGILNLIWLSISTKYLVEFMPGVNTSEQVSYVLHNIWNYYAVVVNTTLTYGEQYISNLIGSQLGALDIQICTLVWVVLLILFLYETLTCHDVPQKIHRYDRITLILIFLLCVALIYTSLYVQWTAFGSDFISGIQGRYFIPVLPLLGIWITFSLSNKEMQEGNTKVYSSYGTWFYIILLTTNGIALNGVISHYL